MKISTSSLLLLIGCSFALALCGATVIQFKPGQLIGEPLLSVGLLGAQFLSAVLILRFSTITKTVFWRIIKFLFGIACLGVMFKILHFAGANIILPGALLAIAVVYLIWFVKKPKRRHLDILKLLWVLSALTIMSLILIRFIDRQYSFISLLFFLLTVLDFMLTEKRLRPFIS